MQQRYEEQQQLLLQLEEVAKLHQTEYMAQKARREAEAKAREKAERRKVVEEEEKKKRILEYLQQLWNEVLEEEATFLESTKGSQVMESKCKEVAAGDKKGQWPSKKAKEK